MADFHFLRTSFFLVHPVVDIQSSRYSRYTADTSQPPTPALLPAAIKVQFTEAEPIVRSLRLMRAQMMMSIVCIGCKTNLNIHKVTLKMCAD